jgi:hypothetical protein
MQNEQFTICPCEGSNACYEQKLEDGNTTWLCFGCGRNSSTLMKEGSDLHTRTLEGMPELYKDLSFTDSDKNVWFPATITIPGQGIVAIDGTNKDNWGWMAAKAIKILEEEKHKFPKGQEYKIDYSTAQHFDQKGFIDALEVIGFYEIKPN